MNKIDNRYSCTSNTVKLLKHLDTLSNIQNGKIVPIMIHAFPTHRCQIDCVHCCFKNREDKTKDISFNLWCQAITQFYNLGTRAMEITGGGDPTLWPKINEGIEYAKSLGMHIGINTNGLGYAKISEDNWKLLDWIRLSLNTLEYDKEIDIKAYLRLGVPITACYIYHDESGKHFKKVVDYANLHKVVCRLAPDCIKLSSDIKKMLGKAEKQLLEYSSYCENKYVFLSDFNIDFYRKDNNCYIHMIKPCLYTDGYVYACPSAELAIENNRQIQAKTRVCKIQDIESFYNSDKAREPLDLNCSYCKYSKQQNFLSDLITPTEFNDFA